MSMFEESYIHWWINRCGDCRQSPWPITTTFLSGRMQNDDKCGTESSSVTGKAYVRFGSRGSGLGRYGRAVKKNYSDFELLNLFMNTVVHWDQNYGKRYCGTILFGQGKESACEAEWIPFETLAGAVRAGRRSWCRVREIKYGPFLEGRHGDKWVAQILELAIYGRITHHRNNVASATLYIFAAVSLSHPCF